MELSYPYICFDKSDIPEEAFRHLDRHIIESVGGGFSSMFPSFSLVFENASRVIENEWGNPKLVLKKGLREWLCFIVVQSDRGNLFFSLQPEFMDKEGELFDEDYLMLPTSWRELYRWFNSFCVTEESYCVMDWWNTPFRFEARLDLNEYAKGVGASKEQVNKCTQIMGCKKEMFRCWLLTESEDALFINEDACDGKVYYINGKDLDNIVEIHDPKKKIDEYLAHYLSGMSPQSFHWLDCID
ncbi:hypothetical protein [Photobacterium nomapromontoriensis]|uniref:hypothetical protein n=1 Tax=Photobacterium nomapromontoriensis TaxID=2910237 RepID=UPI003D146D5A